MALSLHFDAGTLVIPALPDGVAAPPGFVADPRTGVHRAKALAYRGAVEALRAAGVAYEDHARAFEPLPLSLAVPVEPYPHQAAALAAWKAAGSRGIVELPTGAGKTLLAVLAIAATCRPTLVVVPTIELLGQWRDVLARHLGVEVGVVGGGEKDERPITVTTYDSAVLRTEHRGNRHGLLVCDEVHHLPAPSYRFLAEGSLAPFRLGLTATLARADGGEAVCEALLGPLVHRVGIEALSGRYLAPYDVTRLEVRLDPDEQARHDEARATYLAFVRGERISFGTPQGFARFLAAAQRTEDGRRALRAYREQRRIALSARAKVDALWEILLRHRHEPVLVFTDDNETVYRLAKLFLLPALTHETPGPERRRLLEDLAARRLPALLTSRVLNEGVDVPDVAVGVVLSGSGSVREHVQRLGRLLRPRPGKRAVLYELTSAGTAEQGISDRRRQHRAYQEGG